MLSHFRSLAVSILVFLSAAAASQATECDLGYDFGANVTAVKRNLASGDYKQLFDSLARASEEELPFIAESLDATLSSVSADGFRHCKPILTTEHSRDFITEVMVFYTPEDTRIFMYIDAVRLNKGWSLLRLQVTTKADDLADLMIR